MNTSSSAAGLVGQGRTNQVADIAGVGEPDVDLPNAVVLFLQQRFEGRRQGQKRIVADLARGQSSAKPSTLCLELRDHPRFDERGLAGAGRANDGEKAIVGLAEAFQQFRRLPGAPEKDRRLAGFE